MTPAHLDLLLETCLLAGKIMIESDAEMYRVEDTMSRIALASGNYRMVSYVTQTGLFVGIDGTSTIRMVQVMKRGIDLEKISRVNQLSRAYVAGDFSLEELLNKLKVIDSEHRHFPISARIVSAAVVSATIMILFGGVWSDLFLTFLIGGCGYSLYYFSLKFLKIKFLSEFLVFAVHWCSRYSFSQIGTRTITRFNHHWLCHAFSAWCANYQCSSRFASWTLLIGCFSWD